MGKYAPGWRLSEYLQKWLHLLNSGVVAAPVKDQHMTGTGIHTWGHIILTKPCSLTSASSGLGAQVETGSHHKLSSWLVFVSHPLVSLGVV